MHPPPVPGAQLPHNTQRYVLAPQRPGPSGPGPSPIRRSACIPGPGARWRLPACFLEQPEDVAVRVPDLRVGAVGRLFGLALERHPLRLEGLDGARHVLHAEDQPTPAADLLRAPGAEAVRQDERGLRTIRRDLDPTVPLLVHGLVGALLEAELVDV